MSKPGGNVSSVSSLIPLLSLKRHRLSIVKPRGSAPALPRNDAPRYPHPHALICLPLQVLWGVTGTLTFPPTFPGLMSHHRPCLTGWDGLSLDQRQVQARRKGKACQLEGCAAWDRARVLPSQGLQLQTAQRTWGGGEDDAAGLLGIWGLKEAACW